MDELDTPKPEPKTAPGTDASARVPNSFPIFNPIFNPVYNPISPISTPISPISIPIIPTLAVILVHTHSLPSVSFSSTSPLPSHRQTRRPPAVPTIYHPYHRWRHKNPVITTSTTVTIPTIPTTTTTTTTTIQDRRHHPSSHPDDRHRQSRSESPSLCTTRRKPSAPPLIPVPLTDRILEVVRFGSRLWNPINYVPRTTPVNPRPSQPSDENLPLDGNRDAYPLLTIPEQRRSRQTLSPSSLTVERSVGDTESGRNSVAVPRNQRRSEPLDHPGTATEGIMTESTTGPDSKDDDGRHQDLAAEEEVYIPRPHHVRSHQSLRSQTFASYRSGSGGNNTTSGEDLAEEFTWGPAHPCFPHLNPHVPVSSDEYVTTRVIRVRRDWMVKGDLAPTFSNLYPEVLDPLLPEQEFRRVISKVNEALITAFDPFSLRNWFDCAIGLLTGWIWDDLGVGGIKGQLRRLEDWLENWNREVGAKEGVRIWSLRRTAYLCLDIQIPDPKLGVVASEAPSIPPTRPNTGPDVVIRGASDEPPPGL
ncbi:Golgin subfamily A member 7/ERF4 family domain containing protein [Elaphomyces granulatus]